ncbi:MAG: hypothetical protein ACXABO_12265 [Promethearchaeota archaeon]|jgi:hypothetical protein
MSDIYVPIDYSDVKSVIPPGEDIIYSTLCNCSTGVYKSPTKTKIIKWTSHVLITPNGIAYVKADFKKKKNPPTKEYSSWDDVFSIVSMGRLGMGFVIDEMAFHLAREENFETKEKFSERSREFIAKFRPLLIEKKERWLEQNPINTELDKKQQKKQMKERKVVESLIYKMRDMEKKRLAKKAKK